MGGAFYGTGSRSRNIFLELGTGSPVPPPLFPMGLQEGMETAVCLGSLSLSTLALPLLPERLAGPILGYLFAARYFWEPLAAGAYGAAPTAHDDSAAALAPRISLSTDSSWASSWIGFQCAGSVPLLEDIKDTWEISDSPSSVLQFVSFFQYPLAYTLLLRNST